MKKTIALSLTSALAVGMTVLVGDNVNALTLTKGYTTCNTNNVTFSLGDGFSNSRDCEGSYNGNDSNSDLSEIFGDNIFGDFDWQEWSKVNAGDASNINGGLTLNGAGSISGTYSLTGLNTNNYYMIALKGGPNFGLYYLGKVDSSSITGTWETDGIFKGNGQPNPGLSHFTVYTASGGSFSPVSVPEPITILGSGVALVFGGILKNKKAHSKIDP
jgi:hypothetical protein